MKKFLLLLVTTVCLLTSCATFVSVDYIEPAQIDLGQMRSVAIASCVPYSGRVSTSGFGFSDFSDSSWKLAGYLSEGLLKNSVANYATSFFTSTLQRTGYFKITPSSQTDVILSDTHNSNKRFVEMGVDAVIIPKITDMKTDQYIYRQSYDKRVYDSNLKKDVLVKDYKYYVAMETRLQFEYTIISTKYQQVIATKRFTKTLSDTDEITYREWVILDSEYREMFEDSLDSFKSTILSQLVPLGHSVDIELMPNKPKDPSLEYAYDLVKKGNLKLAADAFDTAFSQTGSIVAGYNSALLTASLSDYDGAISKLSNLARITNDKRVNGLLSRLKQFNEKNNKARRQMEGLNSATPEDSTLNIYQQILNDL